MRRTCLSLVHELARADSRVLYIGSDLGAGTLEAMKVEMPERFLMEGVAEANLIGMAAGLAMEGYIPYVNTIATFLTRRCLEQIAVDLCMHKLPVRLIANGGGLVYAPLGPTHEAIEDIALMRALPGMTTIAVCDAEEMRRMMAETIDWPGPIYIRLAKGGDRVVSRKDDPFRIGKALLHEPAGDVSLIACGVMVQRCLEARELLADRRVVAGVLNVHTLKPLDVAAIDDFTHGARLAVTVEEHVKNGGLGSAVAEAFCDRVAPHPPLLRLALPDAFIHNYGSQDELLDDAGLQPPQIAERILATLERLQ